MTSKANQLTAGLIRFEYYIKEQRVSKEKKCAAYVTKINWIIQNIPDETLHFVTNYHLFYL